MKLKKVSIALVVTTLFVLSAFTAEALTLTDGTGDVWHWAYNGTTWSWGGNVADKPDLDITQVSATVTENHLTLSLTVVGTIRASQKIYYWAYYNTTDSTYSMYWANGTGYAFATNHSYGYESGNISISGNTLIAVFDVMGQTSTGDLWGWAAEYSNFANQATNEWWGDWAPNSKLPFTPGTGGNTGNNTGGNNTGNNTGKKTPGFEVLPVIAAVAIAVILLRRRR
jgi:hypothetical protein